MSAFDEEFYLSLYPDVYDAVRGQKSYSSGFEHYQRYGANEGRWGSDTLEYNEVSYLAANPDVAAAVQAGLYTSGYQHYITIGRTEGRLSSPYGYFDKAYYRAENTDFQRIPGYPGYVSVFVPSDFAKQFLTVGVFEGRSPSASAFNEFGYLAKNPDVAAAVFSGAIPSAKAHYDAWGKSEGRDASGRAFDETAYLQKYPDVAQAVQRGLFASGEDHYGTDGKDQGRTASYIGRSIDASAARAGIKLVGAAGDDTLTGGSGNDTLTGLDGNNRIFGNAGDDNITSADGNCTISGGSGDDTITSGDGVNIMDGGSGNDSISSGYGNDTIVGGNGNDTIKASSGSNILTGGDGTDTFIYDGGGVYYFNTTGGVYPRSTGTDDLITDFQVGPDKIDVSGVFAGLQDVERNGMHIMASKTTIMGGRTDYDMSVTYSGKNNAPETTIIFTYGLFRTQSSGSKFISSNRSTIVVSGSFLVPGDFIFPQSTLN